MDQSQKLANDIEVLIKVDFSQFMLPERRRIHNQNKGGWIVRGLKHLSSGDAETVNDIS